jgi:Toxin PAAR-like domain
MLPASSKAGGMCLAMPDVCKTPILGVPVPIPYPNIAQVSNADDCVDKVVIEKKKTVVESSKMSRSMGDEAGVQGGIISSTQMDEVNFETYSSKVYAKGKKICHLTSMSSHNGGKNANMPAGAQIAPSQTKVLVAP